MEVWQLWFLAGIGVFLLIQWIRQHYSLWNLALAWFGLMLFFALTMYVTATGRPVGNMVLSHWLAGLGWALATIGMLNHKYGRHRFPDGLI